MTEMIEAGEFNPEPLASAPALRSFAALGYTAAMVAILLDEPVERVDGWLAGVTVPRPQAIVLELLFIGYAKSFTAEFRARDRDRDPPGYEAMTLVQLQFATVCLGDQHAENQVATDADWRTARRFMDRHHRGDAGAERWTLALAMAEAAAAKLH